MHLAVWDFITVSVLYMVSTMVVLCCSGEHHFIQAPHNKTVKLDGSFRYHCQVSGAEYHVVKWFHNGEEMPRRGQNYRISKEGMLRFTEVKVVDRGKYHCKVGSSFMGTIESPPAYLTVHAPAVIMNKHAMPSTREEAVGAGVHLSCQAAGIPPPVIEWRRNGHLILKNQSNPLEIQTEHDTSPVSLISTLRIIVSQSANYSCSAVNFPLKILSNDTVTVSIRAFKMPGTTERNTGGMYKAGRGAQEDDEMKYYVHPPRETQLCAPYNGNVCKDYLQGRVVAYSVSATLDETEAALESQLEAVEDLGLFSDAMGGSSCEGPARRILCHLMFPDCDNETNQAVPICQESCRAVKSVMCFQHLAELEHMKRTGKLIHNIGLLNLPDCLTLPSKENITQMCLESDHHDFSPLKVTDDCYIEKGRWYNGTINTTKSGHSCQAWLDNWPHKHDRFPLIFPELLGAENFCRNPGGEEEQPWCYTTNTDQRWELCDINPCDDCYMEKGRSYNGTINTTRSGHSCQAWLDNWPHKHDHSPMLFPELLGAENFCRNPGGENYQPWCYTTNMDHRWEVCDINPCDLDREFTLPNNPTNDLDRDKEEEDDLSLLYIVGACALVIVGFIVGILCFLLRHCRHNQYSSTPQDELEIAVESLPPNSAYHQIKSNRLNPKLETLEFPRNDIVFIEDIGQGAFGRVFKARIVCSNGNSHITGGKLSASKHSLTCGKNCKHRNPFSSKGDLRSVDVDALSKSCDSKLLVEHISMFCDHDKENNSMEGQVIAIKMLKEDASEMVQADFEREASLMVEFDHVNIVRLLGVCTLGKPMCLLFEYMSKGDLNEFLRLCSPDQCLRQSSAGSNLSVEDTSSITILDQLHMARQIASGMVYLSERGYVHRDLATRNCLVCSNLAVKISDFGLARSVHSMDYYHGSDKDAIPVRWMPLEAILYNKFSSQSDVWSFGILLWEIFTFALQPYFGKSHEEVVNYLRAGNILDAPEYGTSATYELMKLCWHRKPLLRPSFVSLQKSLSVMYEELTKIKVMNAVNI